MKQTAVAALGIFGPKTVFVQVKEVMKYIIDYKDALSNGYIDGNIDNMSGKV